MFFFNVYLWSQLILKGIFLSKVCFSHFIPFSMHPHHQVAVSYIGTPQINSLGLFIQNLYIRKVNHFKLNGTQVFRHTLYLHDVLKPASVTYSSLSNYKPWSYLHCCQINKKCFRNYNNHKTIEILCCK